MRRKFVLFRLLLPVVRDKVNSHCVEYPQENPFENDVETVPALSATGTARKDVQQAHIDTVVQTNSESPIDLLLAVVAAIFQTGAVTGRPTVKKHCQGRQNYNRQVLVVLSHNLKEVFGGHNHEHTDHEQEYKFEEL